MTRLRPRIKDRNMPPSQRSSYDEELELINIIQRRRRPTDHTGARCRKGTCPCCCHSKASLTWRNLVFRFTNPSSFLGPCDYHECKGHNISVSIRLLILNSRIRFDLLTSLEVSWALGSIYITPILRAKRLVDDQSVSFRLARDFCKAKMSLHEAALALNQAFDSGEASRMDSTLLFSVPEAILYDGVLWTGRPLSEYLQLLDMTGLCHGLPDCLGFPAFFMYGFGEKDCRFLETLEQCNIL